MGVDGPRPPGDEEPLELDWGQRAPRGSDAPLVPAAQATAPAKRKGLPGDPADMSETLRLALSELLTGPGVKVRQQREALQMIAGWDQANQYEVISLEGRPIFHAAEEGRGLLGALSRNLNPFYRNVTDCMTQDGTLALRLVFPWALFFRRAEVLAWDQRPLGRVQQRFHLLRTRVDVLSPGGAVVLAISGPILKFFSFTDWVYEVRQPGTERVVARLKKHWSGWFQEAFSNADNFSIEFEPAFTDPRLRQLLVAAALLVDLVKFDQRESKARRDVGLLGGWFD